MFKMKLWMAHKVSGEDYFRLESEMKKIGSSLEKAGHEPYCSFLKLETNAKNKLSKKELIQNAFDKIDEFDGTLAIIKSDDLSEGMLIEMGYTVARRKKLILAIKKEVMENRYVRAIANQIIEFNNLDDLLGKLGEIK